ncbi:MAG: hypothetical protein DRI90_17005 [Deltaproteobacteria bacterium]|nr:MAG: hypothetical protein DRI90_17005 [Deltaproteobacteria bacterium]
MGFTVISDADTGFHLATGRLVLDEGLIPATNILSFTQPHHPWIVHEWLSGTCFELAWRGGGAAGLLALKLVILLFTFACVLRTARLLSGSPMGAALATLLAAWASAGRFVERPQLFSNAVLAAVALLLVPELSGARTGRRRYRALAAVAALIALNYQLHAGAINSVILLCALAVGALIEPLRATRFAVRPAVPTRGPPGGAMWRRGVLAAAPLAAAIGAALLITGVLLLAYHPHGLAPLWVPFDLGTDSSLRDHVVEFRPPTAFPFALLAPYWVFAAAVVLSIIGLARRAHAGWLVAAVVFLSLSLRHARTVDSFAVVGAPLLALGLASLPLPSRWRETRNGRRLVSLLTAGALVALGIAAPVRQWGRLGVGPGFNRRAWPVDLFQLMRRHRMVGPAFVSDGWAGPYLAEFFPPERAFFDPRFEAYSRRFVLDTYRSIRYGEPGWDAKLDHYGVELALLKYTSSGEAARQKGRPNLRQHLLAHRGWTLVAFNDYGEIFVRSGGRNAALAARHAVVGLDPDRGLFLGRPARSVASLLRLVERGGDNNQVLFMAAVALADAGDRPGALRLLERARRQRPDDPRLGPATSMIKGGP